MSTFDFTPFTRSSVGFDRIFDLLERAPHAAAENYPPYNIERTAEEAYRVTLAVAGFAPDELIVTAQANLLVVAGKRAETKERQYLHQGISQRAFQRQFNLADFVKVTGAHLRDGVLAIDLVREVPDAEKPQRIAIAVKSEPTRIEPEAAA